ncbi:hypothetical protein KFK09_019389 [Dendrobium nobile]|uniref:Reverse transcriptase domain-containing protein n=1 Tax=Dendrobium nobile TaxID=94219 RepID=A0A8T3AQX6_DENNO|nr:hypothetical protein KFK09_019389 [Dendrobium nobile]
MDEWPMLPENQKLKFGDLKFLTKDFSEEEFQSAVFQQGNKKSPGNDGVTSSFFKFYWNIVKNVTWVVFKEFFKIGVMHKEWKDTLIVLIPKIKNSILPSNYRPISLCQTIYKIVATMMVNRIKFYISNIISEEQTAFIPCRSMSEHCLLAQEIFNKFRISKIKNGMMEIKLDMEQAYDRMGWPTLRNILMWYGFPSNFSDLIMECVTNARFSIILNGRNTKWINVECGFHQGCPLSPYLFIMCSQLLSSAIRQRGSDLGVQISSRSENFKNLLYADEVLLSSQAKLHQAEIMKNLIEDFCGWTGLRNNVKHGKSLISSSMIAANVLSIAMVQTIPILDNWGANLLRESVETWRPPPLDWLLGAKSNGQDHSETCFRCWTPVPGRQRSRGSGWPERGRRRAITNKIALLPSLPGLPLIGNIHELGSLPHQSLRELSKKHGSLMLLHLGSIPTLVVSSAKLAQEFMRTHDIVFASRPSSKVSRLLSYNNIDIAFSPYGDCWRQLRRISVNNLLGQKMVQSFSIVRSEEVSQLLERISDQASRDNGVVCITEMLNSLVSNILCRVVLGSSMSDDRTSLVCELVQRNSTFFSVVFFEDLFPKLRWLDVLLGFEAKLRTHFNTWDSLLEEFIENHLNRCKDGADSNGTNTDFIDILLQLQRDSNTDFVLTRNHIKAILMDMFAAGTDTSFITLDWTMAELIQNPEVMKKAQDEVREIANGDEKITEERLGQLKYLNAVIKEVLRLHPPIPLLLPRVSTEACKMQGYNIPKETRVLINAWAIGRDRAYWDSPDEFIPERFLGSTIDYRGRDFHFIPFGAGRRICPGMPFAVAVVELTLANLLLRFNWTLPSGISKEVMKMEDSPGLVSLRKQKLELVPTLVKIK